MKNKMTVCLLTLGLLASSACFAGINEGMAAYNENNYEVTLKEWLPLAKRGNADAQFGMGMMCENGQGLPQDYAQAVSWYKKAAGQGHTEAMTSMGWMYKKGQGVSQNYAKAVSWYQKAAERGSGDAMALLGTMYKNGQGVPQNYARAAGWYQKASDQGEVTAKFQLLDIQSDCKNNPDINGCAEVNKSH
jgi:uncharacterized protein